MTFEDAEKSIIWEEYKYHDMLQMYTCTVMTRMGYLARGSVNADELIDRKETSRVRAICRILDIENKGTE